MAYFHKEEHKKDVTERRSLTDDEIKYLKELQTELNTQVVVGQAEPYYFVIKDYKKIYGDSVVNADGICVMYDDDEPVEIYEGDFLDYEDLYSVIAKFFDEHGYDYEKNEEVYSEYGVLNCFHSKVYITEYEEVVDYKNFFLTQKAAQEHLRLNYYHYSKNAHTYAMTIWRSQEELLFKLLKEIDFDLLKGNK